MELSNNSVGAVILAAGRGSRMHSDLPKALFPLAGKPMLHYIVNTIQKLSIKDINVVLGYKASEVKGILHKSVNYVYQPELLGTANALNLALSALDSSVDTVLVVNCDDSAFYESVTLRDFIKYHFNGQFPVSILTSRQSDPNGLGRIIRDKSQKFTAVVEEADASSDEKSITEVNAGCYLFNVNWARKHIPLIPKSSHGEFYLTQCLGLAVSQGREVGLFPLKNPQEWSAVNTQEELAHAESKMVTKLAARNKPSVVVFDFDNTVFDSHRLKLSIPLRVQQQLQIYTGKEFILDELSQKYLQIYESSRQQANQVDFPQICSLLAKELGNIDPSILTDSIYSMDFNSFIREGFEELFNYISNWSKIVLFAYGDLVYEPIKLVNLSLINWVSDYYVATDKLDFLPKLAKIYKGYNFYFVDDQIQQLELVNNIFPQATTIHLNQGPYQDQQPSNEHFTPTFSSKSIDDLTETFHRQFSQH